MSLDVCPICKCLYFPNIWKVKSPVSRRAGIINKQKQWVKRNKRQWCWRRPGQQTRFQNPKISERLPDSERAQTISANTNIGNSSRMEFTRAHGWAGLARKTVGLNQAELNGNRTDEANSCFSRQAGRLHAEEGRSATSAQLSGQGVWGNLLGIEFEAERKCEWSGEQRNDPEPKFIETKYGKWDVMRLKQTFSTKKMLKVFTKAVGFVGDKRLACGGYLLLGTKHSFDDKILDLTHQH